MLISSVIVKIISAFYKIPLTAYIGAEGRGYFSVAYNLCLPIHAITMGALPIALTKLVSTANAKNDMKSVYAFKSAAKKLFFIAGAVGTLIMLLIAKPYTSLIATSSGSALTCLALAPSLFFSCACAVYRAYAEGFLDMKLTALSQLVEVLSKLIFGLVLARMSMRFLYSFYLENGTVLGIIADSEEKALAMIYPITSAFAMFGATAGSVIAYLIAVIYNRINYPDNKVSKADIRTAYSKLLNFSVSVIGATAVQSIANFIDTSTVQYALSKCSAAALSELYSYSGDDVHTYVFGIFATALDFKNLIPSIVMALGVAAVPALSTAFEGAQEGFSKLFESIIKYSVILSSLGSVALMFFGDSILLILFGKYNPDIAENGGRLLYLFGLTNLPFSVSSAVVYCTQALGFARQTIPCFAVSAALRAVLNISLIRIDSINVSGAVISSFVGYSVILVWCLLIITKRTNARLSITRAFLLPLSSAAVTYFALDYIKMRNIGFENIYVNMAFYGSLCLIFFLLSLLLTKSLSFKEIKVNK